MKNQVQYFKTPDGHSSYKVNHELKRITRICNNKRTFPDWTELDTILSETIKLIKYDWHRVENVYFISQPFEWEFEGERYRTSDIPFMEKQLQANPNWDNGRGYPFLAFNNGQIWETYLSANYLPKVQLTRIGTDGKRLYRWTDIKYIRNFEKIS